MSKSLYIAAIEPASGKSLVALGLTELISHRINRLGFFRPVIRAGDAPDNDIELIRNQYSLSCPYDKHFAVTYDHALDLSSSGREQELLKLIVAKYKELEEQCDFIICEGTDFTGISSAFEFLFNARVANHLGCPVVIAGSGQNKSMESTIDVIRSARRAFAREHCTIAASIINRVSPDDLPELQQLLQREWTEKDPIFALPERPELAAPTMGEIASALDARVLFSDVEKLTVEALNYKIAAMHLPNFLNHIEQGSLVIAPGDRADIILGSLATAYSEGFPKISGLLLTGGLEPAPQVSRLIGGFARAPIPILMVDSDTHETSMHVDSIRAVIAPDNQRKIATALGIFEANVDLEALSRHIEITRSTAITPLMFEYDLITRAKAHRQHIVLPEGSEDRILLASEILLRREVAELTLLGNEEQVRNRIASLGVDLDDITIIDPAASKHRNRFAALFTELRSHKGMTLEVAADMMLDVNYFGTMMVQEGLADGMVSGSIHTTTQTIRPAFQIIKTRDNCATASSVFFMCLEDRVLVYGDCAINPNPNAQQLADIAMASAETAAMFGIEPRVAMLSYSTGKSGHGEDVDRVVEATKLARAVRPDLKIEGPIQYDAAIDASVASTKLPDSEVAGRATVFVFPDLNTGNNTYKAVQRSAGALAVGPVLQGLRKPVNDLSRGCTVADIVNTVAITAVQAHMMKQLA
ncbi:MAG: phosphate acetyltransferase [Bythopirellula sp.]